MNLVCPPYMELSDRDKVPLRFVWDDTRASKDFTTDASWILEAATPLSRRAQMVLCVGLYEWIMWRFEGLHRDPQPAQIAQAAWCATVDPRYMRFFELHRADWTGPIGGPLWCAITWLRPALMEGDHARGEVAEALEYLTRMACHVLPEPRAFLHWLKGTLQRFATLFPPVPDDPFADLFDHGTGARRGPLIGRDALDPTVDYQLDMGPPAMAQLLQTVNPEDNPFLADPEDMAHAGFTAHAYRLD